MGEMAERLKDQNFAVGITVKVHSKEETISCSFGLKQQPSDQDELLICNRSWLIMWYQG